MHWIVVSFLSLVVLGKVITLLRYVPFLTLTKAIIYRPCINQWEEITKEMKFSNIKNYCLHRSFVFLRLNLWTWSYSAICSLFCLIWNITIHFKIWKRPDCFCFRFFNCKVLFAAVCSAIDCYVCTYKDGADVMPDVPGVTWATAGSASYTSRCKDGEASNTVSETCPNSGDSCIVSCQH